MALAISSIIVISLNSTLALAVRSVPSVNSEVQRDIEFSRILRQIETEAETCLRVLHASMDSFSIIVADRDGDANPEKIRYFTAGTESNRSIDNTIPMSRNFFSTTWLILLCHSKNKT